MQQPHKNYNKITALYCRLSRDDEQYGDSSSIQTQKILLENYAKQHALPNQKFYVDDGYSGTSFNRPDFINLKTDIENGLVSTVIVKDLSRFGRDYLQVGMFTEHYFPDNDIRFIAVEDNVDSDKGGNEFAPFRNIMNEWYARDVSKKVRAGFKIKSSQGLFTAPTAPFGYIKDPSNKHKLIIDQQAAMVVKQMFELSASGLSIHAIAKHLKQNKIQTPREIEYSKTGKFAKSVVPFPYHWADRSIHTMLQNRVYIGHMVNQKTTTKSYKNRKTVYKDKSEWIEVKNTHEAIVSEQLFDLVQKEISIKRRDWNKSNFVNLFAGKVFCFDCGKPLNLCVERYSCSRYRRFGKQACSAHGISYKRVYDTVLGLIKDDLTAIALDTNYFVSRLNKSIGDNSDSKKQALSKSIAKAEKRILEIDSIIRKLYEDNVLGKITDDRFVCLSQDYEKEQAELKDQLITAKKELSALNEKTDNADKFLAVITRYKDLTDLSQNIILELVDKIVVHESKTVGTDTDNTSGATGKVKKSQLVKTQKIEIYYNFVGNLNQNTADTKQADNTITPDISFTPTLYISQPA